MSTGMMFAAVLDAAVAGGLVAVALAAIKVIDRLVLQKRADNGMPKRVEHSLDLTREVHAIVTARDPDQVPMVWSPRWVIELQKQMAETTRTTNELIRTMTEYQREHQAREEHELKRIAAVLEKLDA